MKCTKENKDIWTPCLKKAGKKVATSIALTDLVRCEDQEIFLMNEKMEKDEKQTDIHKVLQVDELVIPQELLDLVRFLAQCWATSDDFVLKNCTGDQLMSYPVVQGTTSQINLRNIGRQPYDSTNIPKAVKWLLSV